MFFKKKVENYIRNWKDRDAFEKYAIIVYIILIFVVTLITIKSKNEFLSRCLNILPIVFLAFMLKRVKKANQQIVNKNKEIEEQKRMIEDKQKDIIDSIKYARRIQHSLLPTEKYIEKSLTNLQTKKHKE